MLSAREIKRMKGERALNRILEFKDKKIELANKYNDFMCLERLIYIQCFISIYANVMSHVGVKKSEEVNFPTQKALK